MYERVAMYISTVYSTPPLLTSTPADSPQSETVSGDDVKDNILSSGYLPMLPYDPEYVCVVVCEQSLCVVLSPPPSLHPHRH